MDLIRLAVKNLLRNKLRSALTIAGVAVAVLAFTMLRTVTSSWKNGTSYADQGRVVTRHKVTFVMSLPKKYVEQVKQIPGVANASWASWWGGKDPRPEFEHEFFATLACDAKTFLEVYPENGLPEDQKEKWLGDRQGLIIGANLAKKLGFKVGDKVKLDSQIYHGDWTFNVDGIYNATRKSMDNSTIFFHWEYMNEGMRDRNKDMVGWITSRVAPGAKSADVAKAIDDFFDVQDTQTLSQDEGSFQHSFLGMFSAVITAMDVVSLVILGIMMLILGNTVAMGTRERVSEYGVLRAIGFLPKDIATLVVGESAALGIFGGFIGLALAVPFINFGMGRWIEENMGGMFPYFRVPADTAVIALGLATLLGVISGALPAWRSSQLKVVESLRRVA